MGLKADREVLTTNVNWRITTGVSAERGCILVATATAGVCDKGPASLTGKVLTGLARPIGLLLDDVEDLDYTTRPQILCRNVVPRGSEVSVLTKGRVKTNMMHGAAAPSGGRAAYLTSSGLVHTTAGSGIKIGFFESTKDADGYADLFVDFIGVGSSGV